jgi:iron(III) transport system substrate-binding protein
MMSNRLAVLGMIILTALATACEALPEIRASASSSGRLTILGSTEEVFVLGMANAFEAETGVKTTYERLSTGEALAKLQAERASPRFSVWWGGPVDSYIEASGEGLIEPYRPRGFGTLPRQYRDETGAWTGIYVGVLAFGVNTAALSARGLPPPTGWADLVKSEYQDLIAMGHPATSGTGYTILATVMQMNNKNIEVGFDYLAALSRNVAQYTRSGAEAARVVGRGEVAVGIAFSHDIVDAAQISPDLRVVFPGDGTGYEIGGMALVKGAPDSVEGKRFMDWAISQRAQELGPSFRAYQIPTNPDAQVSPLSARLASIKTIDYDFRWAGNRRDELVRRFQSTIASAPV